MSILELQEQIKKHIESIHSEFDLKMLLEKVTHLHFSKTTEQVRVHGSGKDIFGKMSDDFNEPLDFPTIKHK